MAENKYQNKGFIFEGCKSLDDEIIFTNYQHSIQPKHQNLTNFIKFPILRTPFIASTTDLNLFKPKFKSQVSQLREHYNTMQSALQNGFQISSQLSIKLGYKYFHSRLFRWDIPDLTIQELISLSSKNIDNTDERYYHQNDENDYPFHQILKSTFTDHSSINGDLYVFYQGLIDMGFLPDETPTIVYRFTYNNNKKLFDELFVNSDSEVQQDVFIQNLFTSFDKFELKYDQNFKIMSIFPINSENTDSIQTDIDLIRYNDKYNVRFQAKQKLMIANEMSDNLKRLLNNLIIDSSQNAKQLTLNGDPANINFMRREEFIKYTKRDAQKFIDFEVNMINYDEYIEFDIDEDNNSVYRANVHVEKYAKMTANLSEILKNFENNNINYDQEFLDTIWSMGVWLSNCASNSLKMAPKSHPNNVLIFEGCESLDDEIEFVRYAHDTQPIHEHIKKFMMAPILKTPFYDSIIVSEIFNTEFNLQILQLREHYYTLLSSFQNGFQISSQLSIKLGYKYFHSRLFRWDIPDLTIKELISLSSKNIDNTDERYYNTNMSANKNRFYQVLKSTFTDHSSIKGDLNVFENELTNKGFLRDETPTTIYRFIYNNKHALLDELFVNSDSEVQQDEFIQNLFTSFDKFELKYDQNFKIMSIFPINSENTDSIQTDIDLIRYNDKYNVRFQAKQKLMIANEMSDNLKRLLNNLIIDSSQNAKQLTLNGDPANINFMRREEFIKYTKRDAQKFIDFEVNMINYDEYIEFDINEDNNSVYRANVHVENYAKMTANLSEILKNFEKKDSDYVQDFYYLIESMGIWLSDCASNLE